MCATQEGNALIIEYLVDLGERAAEHEGMVGIPSDQIPAVLNSIVEEELA